MMHFCILICIFNLHSLHINHSHAVTVRLGQLKQIMVYKPYYYLFKKILVSDWLTANCEIVISTQWPTKYGFFAFILAK
jgi:hypothetical protein